MKLYNKLAITLLAISLSACAKVKSGQCYLTTDSGNIFPVIVIGARNNTVLVQALVQPTYTEVSTEEYFLNRSKEVDCFLLQTVLDKRASE